MKVMPASNHPQAPAGPPGTEELVRLGTAIARLGRGFRAASAGHGLSPSQLAVLATVVRDGPIGLTALAEAEAINPTLLSRIVGRLEEEGLVERHPGENDRRCIVVAATAAGRRLQARVRSERSASLAARLDRLSARDARAIFSALPALERLARAEAVGTRA
jgi:DNA-binding MarR family transcriptional regulator